MTAPEERLAELLDEPDPGSDRLIADVRRDEPPLDAWLRKLAAHNFSDSELKAAGRGAVERITHNQAGAADCRPAAPEATDCEGVDAMTNHRTSKHPMSVMLGEVIIEHPDTGEEGRWAVAHPPVRCGEVAEIEVIGGAGPDRFTVDVHAHLAVRQKPRHAVIEGLRELATFLEDHPHMPVNREVTVPYSASIGRARFDAAAEVNRVADILGVTPGRQRADGPHHIAVRWFGPVRYEASAVDAYETTEPALAESRAADA